MTAGLDRFPILVLARQPICGNYIQKWPFWANVSNKDAKLKLNSISIKKLKRIGTGTYSIEPCYLARHLNKEEQCSAQIINHWNSSCW